MYFFTFCTAATNPRPNNERTRERASKVAPHKAKLFDAATTVVYGKTGWWGSFLYLAADERNLAGDIGECLHVQVRRRGYTATTTSTTSEIATAIVVATGLRSGRGLQSANRLCQPHRSGKRACNEKVASGGPGEDGTNVERQKIGDDEDG